MLIHRNLLLLCFCGLFAACNNSGTSDKRTDSPQKARNLAIPADSLSREALFSFIDGCIDNTKTKLGEEKAFGFCKCIYEELRQANPEADSVQIDNLINDTAQVARMAASCQ